MLRMIQDQLGIMLAQQTVVNIIPAQSMLKIQILASFPTLRSWLQPRMNASWDQGMHSTFLKSGGIMFDHWKQASVQMFGGVDKDVIK